MHEFESILNEFQRLISKSHLIMMAGYMEKRVGGKLTLARREEVSCRVRVALDMGLSDASSWLEVRKVEG